jgi:uncharacterized membrane protein YozB (DUF420 family)
MFSYLEAHGFLGTKAGLGADLTLVLSIVAAVLFTIGVVLAKRGKLEAHGRMQTAAVCLNAILVLLWMVRSLVVYILPEIPAKLGERSYAVTTVHAVAGLIGVLLGVFIVLRANDLVPLKLRFTDYKPWMRISYVLYMLATLGGVVAYVLIYRG